MMISHGLWQRMFGGNRSAIGSVVEFEGKAYTLVGIAPESFQLGENVDVFTPLGQDESPGLRNRDRHPGINVVARLGEGISLQQAGTELGVIGQQLAKQYPEYGFGVHKGYGTKVHRDALAATGPCAIHRLTFLKKAATI